MGFDDFADDISLTGATGTANISGATFAGSGESSYTVTLTGVSGAGEIDVSVQTGTNVTDPGGCPLNSSVSLTLQIARNTETHYVDVDNTGNELWPYDTPETAATITQDAVDAASDGDMVLVAPGTYSDGGRTAPGQTLMTRVVVERAITLQGTEGREVTIIEGQGPQGGGAVRCVSLGSVGATLDGFTLREGHTLPGYTSNLNAQGGGIQIIANDCMVQNCVIEDCEASGGGGIYVALDIPNPTLIRNCAIRGNEAGEGGGVYLYSSATISDCLIEHNTAGSYGGGVRALSGTPTFTDSIIRNNTGGTEGGGLWLDDNGIFVRCEISGNAAGGNGGGLFNEADGDERLLMENCLIIGNVTAASGGGVYSDDASLVNCTISGNQAALEGGGLYLESESGEPVDIHNSVIWNNEAAGSATTLSASLVNPNGIVVTVSHSLVANSGGSGPNWAIDAMDGGGNIDADPLFVEPMDPLAAPSSNGDFRRRLGSPAIDMGDNSFVADPGNAVDLVGRDRILDGVVEMGAYEQFSYLVTTHIDENDSPAPGVETSLREAIALANADPLPSVIEFDNSFSTSQVIKLNKGELQIQQSVAIVGPGASLLTLDADKKSRVFLIDDAQSDILLDVRLSGLTLAGGRSDSDSGGAIFNREDLSLGNCFFLGSFAHDSGGAIFNDENSSVTLINCSFLGNFSYDSGGAIHNDNNSSPILINCSFQGNNSDADHSFGGGAIYNGTNSSPVLINCIIWHNRSENSVNTRQASIYNADGAAPTYSHCLIQNYSVDDLGAGSGNLDGTNADNDPQFILPILPVGEFGETELITLGDLRLSSDSPVIDVGDNAANSAGADLAGRARKSNNAIDLGAYEHFSYSVTTHIDEDNGVGAGAGASLREAIALANADPLPSVIEFDKTVFGTPQTITLSLGELHIQQAVTLAGPGASRLAIDADEKNRVFLIDDAQSDLLLDVRLSGLTLIGGSSDSGGAIRNEEDLKLVHCSFQGNHADDDGGAIYNDSSSSLTFASCLFQGNHAGANGGAIYNENGSLASFINGSFQGNFAGSEGGAIYNENNNSLILLNCVIWHNRAGMDTTSQSASVFDQTGSAYNYENCLIQNYSIDEILEPNLDGTDFNNDPLFASPINPVDAPTTEGDLRLLYGSPVIGVGDDGEKSVAVNPITDLAGRSRIQGRIDLGAYEGVYPTAGAIIPTTRGPTSASTLMFTVVFTKAVVNFNDSGDLLLIHSGSADAEDATIAPIDDFTYTVTLTGVDGDGTLRLAVNLDSDVEDLNGAPLIASVTSAAVTIDNTAAITIDDLSMSFGGDGVINAAGLAAGQMISGTTDVEDGQAVEISIGFLNATSGVISGTWSVTIDHDGSGGALNISGLADGTITVTAYVPDLAGNTAQASGDFELDRMAPTITIDDLSMAFGGDNVINATELETGQTIQGAATGVEDGEEVTVSVGGLRASSTVLNGRWSITVDHDGSGGALNISGLANGMIDVTADVSDRAGNPATQAPADFVLDHAPDITITIPVEGDDNVINKQEMESGFVLRGTTDAEAGQVVTVEITDGQGTSVTNAVTAVAQSNGEWSLRVGDMDDDLDISGLSDTFEVRDLLTVSATVSNAVGIAGNHTIGPLDADAVELDRRANISFPIISGNDRVNAGEIGQSLTVRGDVSDVESGRQISLGDPFNTTVIVVNGEWSVTLDLSGVSDGVYTGFASVTDEAGNEDTEYYEWELDRTAPTVGITDPAAADNAISAAEAALGFAIDGVSSGLPGGARVRVELEDQDGNIVVGQAGVNPAGDWSLPGFEDPSRNYLKTGVNSTTAHEQEKPVVIALNDGGWLAVWQSRMQDSDGYGIYFQRYNSQGRAVDANGVNFSSAGSGETLVNTTTSDDQESPQAGALPYGGWVIVWASDAQDGDGGGIYFQRFNESGEAVNADGGALTMPGSGEILVNSTTAGGQSRPVIAVMPDGAWLIAWEAPDLDQEGVYLQRFNAQGVKVDADGLMPSVGTSGETQVNWSATGDQFFPAVRLLVNGGWVVAWRSRTDDGSPFVYVQRYNEFGMAMELNGQTLATDGSGETRVSDRRNGDDVRLVGLPDGGWLVVWNSSALTGFIRQEVYARRFNSDGSFNGNEQRLNTLVDYSQERPSATLLIDQGWIVAWDSQSRENGVDISEVARGVFLQRYDANGVAVDLDGVTPSDGNSGEIQVNDHTLASQTKARVAGLADGGWVVVWQSEDQDGDGVGVYQKRYSADGRANDCGVDISGLVEGAITITATARDNAGNESTDTHSVTLDRQAPTITITAPVAGDGVINVQERTAGFVLSGSSGGAEAGQIVTVEFTDSAMNTALNTTAAIVQGDGSWSLTVGDADEHLDISGLLDGMLTIRVATADLAGNPASDVTGATLTSISLGISPISAALDEGDGGFIGFTFRVTRSGDLSESTTVNYSVAGSGANPADANDFGGALPSGMVVLAPNATMDTVIVPVSGDTDVESHEQFTVTLSGATGGAVILASTAFGTIQDDDSVLTFSSGDLIIADRGPAVYHGAVNLIGRTGPTTQSVVSTLMNDPYDVAIDQNGDFIVIDYETVVSAKGRGTQGLYRIDRLTLDVTLLSTGGQFVVPAGVVVEPDGRILVLDIAAFNLTGAVFRVDPSQPLPTGQTVLARGGVTGSHLYYPTGIGIAPVGAPTAATVYVSDIGNGGDRPPKILEINPVNGAQRVVALGRVNVAAGERTFIYPAGLDVGLDGKVLVVDAHARKIFEVDPYAEDLENNARVISEDAKFIQPTHVAIDPVSGHLFVTDAIANGGIGRSFIFEIDPANGDLSGNAAIVTMDGIMEEPRGIKVVP